MKVHAVDPNVDTSVLLAAAQFSDAFSVVVDDAALDARQAAERMLGRSPRWVERLLALRNHLMTPFGLKTGAPNDSGGSDVIGIFPVPRRCSRTIGSAGPVSPSSCAFTGRWSVACCGKS